MSLCGNAVGPLRISSENYDWGVATKSTKKEEEVAGRVLSFLITREDPGITFLSI